MPYYPTPIQMKCLYIDEGPYMPTLEHLIQHYQRFSDGLPINLRHPVPPKPKPPLPLFTIPRSARTKHGSVSAAAGSSPTSTASTPPPAAKRNMSVPSDALMNTVGLLSPPSPPARQDNSTSPLSTSPTTPGRTTITSDILNFRSLKLPSARKNIIIDGVKSLKKTKKSKKSTAEAASAPSAPVPVELSMSLRNLSFSSDLKPIVADAAIDVAGAELYNVPRNNAAVVPLTDVTTVDALMPPDTEPPPPPPPPMLLTAEQAELTAEYFTESDNFASRDMGTEEIYFIDAPAAAADADAHSIAYTAFKVVPHFPDGTEIPQTPKVCTTFFVAILLLS